MSGTTHQRIASSPDLTQTHVDLPRRERPSVSRARPTEAGQGAVEMAMTLPLVFILIMGCLELGFAFNAYVTLVSAAREGARAGAVYLYDSAYSMAANDLNRENGTATGSLTPYAENIRDSVENSLGALKKTSPNFDKNANVDISYIPPGGTVFTRRGDYVSVEITYRHDLFSQALGDRSFIWMTAQASARIE